MVPNLLGTEFRQLDHRVDPRDPVIMDYVEDKGKNELAAVAYDLNVMGRQAAYDATAGLPCAAINTLI